MLQFIAHHYAALRVISAGIVILGLILLTIGYAQKRRSQR